MIIHNALSLKSLTLYFLLSLQLEYSLDGYKKRLYFVVSLSSKPNFLCGSCSRCGLWFNLLHGLAKKLGHLSQELTFSKYIF